MKQRGLKSRTMSTYLSGVRMYHIVLGYNEPCLRETMVKLILKGQNNQDKLRERLNGKVGRLPVTVKMMKLIKLNLGKVKWAMEEVRLFWAVATLAWTGSFRIHELCSRKERDIDQQTTLLWRDLKWGTVKVDGKNWKSLSIHVKSPKIDRVGAGDNIEVVQLNNFMCPVAAMEKYGTAI